MKPVQESPRILVISPNWIGDAVMAQPLLKRLREQHAERPIDILSPTSVAAVWKSMREVDSVIETPFRHGPLQLTERRKFARMLKQNGYADAYVLPNTLKYALIPWLAGIPRRIGYKGEMRYGLINVMHHDDPLSPRPMAQYYTALAEPPAERLPRLPKLPRPEMSVTTEIATQVMRRKQVSLDKPYIVFAPGAEYGPAKRWPASHFASLAKEIKRSLPDVDILLLGAGKDVPVCEEIAASSPVVRNFAGMTTLAEAIALIAKASAVVSNDSGLMHIACALGRPTVAVFGPTNPMHTPPLSDRAKVLWLHLECAPCQQRECPLGHHHCMTGISPDAVWEHLKPMVEPSLAERLGITG